jgi:hypothetical protein
MTAAEHREQKARVLGSLKVDEQREHHRDAPTPRRYHRTPVVQEIVPQNFFAPAGDWSWR